MAFYVLVNLDRLDEKIETPYKKRALKIAREWAKIDDCEVTVLRYEQEPIIKPYPTNNPFIPPNYTIEAVIKSKR